jgi:hypothetical protein
VPWKGNAATCSAPGTGYHPDVKKHDDTSGILQVVCWNSARAFVYHGLWGFGRLFLRHKVIAHGPCSCRSVCLWVGTMQHCPDEMIIPALFCDSNKRIREYKQVRFLSIHTVLLARDIYMLFFVVFMAHTQSIFSHQFYFVSLWLYLNLYCLALFSTCIVFSTTAISKNVPYQAHPCQEAATEPSSSSVDSSPYR